MKRQSDCLAATAGGGGWIKTDPPPARVNTARPDRLARWGGRAAQCLSSARLINTRTHTRTHARKHRHSYAIRLPPAVTQTLVRLCQSRHIPLQQCSCVRNATNAISQPQSTVTPHKSVSQIRIRF